MVRVGQSQKTGRKEYLMPEEDHIASEESSQPPATQEAMFEEDDEAIRSLDQLPQEVLPYL